MNSFVLAYVGGIVGAVLMDITETLASGVVPDERRQHSPWSAAGRWACCAGNGLMPTSPAPRHGRARCGRAGRFTFSSVAAGSRCCTLPSSMPRASTRPSITSGVV